LALVVFEVFELHHIQLLAREKFEDALELASIKSSLEIGKTPRLGRRRTGDARFLFSNCVEEIQRLAASVSLHVPVGKRTLDRVPQKNQQFDLRIVIPNPLHRRLVIKVTRCAITCDGRGSNRRIMFMQFVIIRLGDEHRVVIEKMYFLLVAHADVGMSAQKVMQRCSA